MGGLFMARRAAVQIAIALIPSFVVLAHPGGTNKNGCHTNSKTGDYHCHGGSSAPPPPAPPTSTKPTTTTAPSKSTGATYFVPTKRPAASGTKPSATAAAPTPAATEPSPELVKATQNLLRILGYQVEANGLLTSGTRVAVDLAQRQEKLTPTGVPNELLLVRLTERVTAHVKKRCW